LIKGEKDTLLLRRENLTLESRQVLRTLLRTNNRPNTAYLLVLWPTLELRARGLGAMLLQELARIAQMAEALTLREDR
jgi:hypothetical protein